MENYICINGKKAELTEEQLKKLGIELPKANSFTRVKGGDYYYINRTVKVTAEDIDDIMASALEGGINYWCGKAEVVGEYLGEFASEQISRGGSLILHDIENDETDELTLPKFLKGIQMAIQHNYYADYDWCNGNEIDTCQVDASVADVIIQLALFDDVIYG